MKNFLISTALLISSFNLSAMVKPDLSISNYFTDSNCKVHLVISNKGNAGLSESIYSENKPFVSVRVFGTVKYFWPAEVDPQKKLKTPGASTEFILSRVPSVEGEAEMAIFIDYGNKVDESNENNNKLSKTITCQNSELPGKPVIKVLDFYPDKDCNLKIVLNNQGPGTLSEYVWDRDSIFQMFIGVAWDDVTRINQAFWDIDITKKLKNPSFSTTTITIPLRSNTYPNLYAGKLLTVKTYPTNLGTAGRHSKEKFIQCGPDLMVSNIIHSPSDLIANNVPKKFTVVIKNSGTTTTPSVKLKFRFGGESNSPIFDVPSLEPQAQHAVSRMIVIPIKGQFIIDTAIDLNNVLNEIDESNNLRRKSVIIK